MNRELKSAAYILVLGVVVFFAGVFWWAALTAPMIASDGPIILSIFVTVVAYLIWRQRRKYV